MKFSSIVTHTWRKTTMANKSNQALWENRITAWSESGLSQKEFCNQNGISASAFHYWRKRLRKEAAGSQPFVEVKTPSPGKDSHKESPHHALTLRLSGGIEIMVNAESDLSFLLRVINALENRR